MANTVEEFRGTDNLVYAEITEDSSENFTTGEVKNLAPVAEIAKTVETGSATKYYDNKPALVINSEGADTVTLTISALDLATLADITGKTIDADTGAFIDGEAKQKYFAIGYRLKLTDGSYRYVWRLKGSFGVPEEDSKTEDNGTDSSGQTLTYTGIQTTHKFTKTKASAKAVVVDERDGKADVSTFFAKVVTPDDLKAKVSSMGA